MNAVFVLLSLLIGYRTFFEDHSLIMINIKTGQSGVNILNIDVRVLIYTVDCLNFLIKLFLNTSTIYTPVNGCVQTRTTVHPPKHEKQLLLNSYLKIA